MMLQAGREAPQASTQALKLIMHKLHSFIHPWVYTGTLKVLLSNNREPPPLLHSLLPTQDPAGKCTVYDWYFPKQTCIHGSMKN